MAATQQYTYPGVYLDETQAITRQITPATTNWLAVLGVFPQGPTDEAVLVRSWSDFEAQFGGLTAESTLATYAMWQFFLNGGTGAWVVRLTSSEGTNADAELGQAVEVSAKFPGVSPNGWTVTLAKSRVPKAPANALDLTLATANKETLELLPALDGTTAAGLANAITGTSNFLSAAAVATPKEPVKPDTETLGGGTHADSPPTARVGELVLSGKSPGALMNDWTVALVPAGSAAAPAAGFANLTVTGKTPTGDAVSEVVTNLPTANVQVLAQMISTQSDYVNAAAAPPVTVAPGTGKLAGGAAATALAPAKPATATVSALTLQARVPGTAPNGWTVTFKAAAAPAPAGNLDFTLTGPATPEALPNLPGDLQELALAISARSAYVTAPLSAQLDALVSGDAAQWNAGRLTDAILTELGMDPNSGADPPPVPRLDQIAPQHFNLMCMPDAAWLPLDNQVAIFNAAHAFCSTRQAFLIVDPPPPASAGNVPGVLGGGAAGMTIDSIGTKYDQLQALLGPKWGGQFAGADNVAGATFYPWVEIPDPANNFMARPVPPSGTVAGVFARTDDDRGVWKAPAGVEAQLRGVTGLADTTITDVINGDLNVTGINCLRTFPTYDSVVWGSRTLAGADLNTTAFKYVPARRLSDFIEQSLQQSLKWAVFEPNEPTLWAAITAQILPFMAGLYSAGAFTGATAKDAFSVTCDATTTSADDILRGVVNIQVKFNPAEPAEFVVLNVQIGALAGAAS